MRTLSGSSLSLGKFRVAQLIQFIYPTSQRANVGFGRRAIMTSGAKAVVELIIRWLRELRTDPGGMIKRHFVHRVCRFALPE